MFPRHEKTKAMKKPYHPPKLTIYGDLTTMTNFMMQRGAKPDGGTMVGMKKT